jgi:hypothetical protein
MKRAVLAALIFALALGLSAQSREGNFLFQIGAGPGFPSYPSVLDSAFSYAESQPGVTRLKIGVDLSLGYAFSDKGYIVAGLDGMGDRLSDSSSSFQFNTYLFSGGLRYYPSVTGFYMGAGAGSAKYVTQSTGYPDYTSPAGFGWNACAGYDFCSTPRGFGLALEAKYCGLNIES